jgi:ABC-type nitrate/sulfonate/bicarbonate transport system substrate-binding protein
LAGLSRAALAAGAACVCLLAACGGDDGGGGSAADGPVKVGYGYGFDAGDTGDRVAFSHMARHGGPKATLRETGSPQNAVTALLRGDIDMADLSQATVINAVAEGADLHIVLTANRVPEWEMVSSPEITSVAQLRGKRLGTFGPNSDTATLDQILLERAGLRPGDVEEVALMDSQKRALALANGRLDATALEFVDRERLRKELPGFHILGALRDFSPVRAQVVYAMSGDFLRKHRGRARRIVQGLLDGYATLYEAGGRRAFVAEAGRSTLKGEPPKLAGDAYDFYRRLGFWPRRGQVETRRNYDRTLAYWKRYGIVQKGAPFGRVWDTSLLR